MEENQESKLKLFFTKLKKMWNNRRYRSVLILLMYFVFFAIMFLLLNIGTENVHRNYEQVIHFKNYDIYSFSTDIDINGMIYSIEGKRYKENYEFTYNEQTYNMNYDDIKQSDIDKNIINSFEYMPDFLDNIINNSKLVSEKKIIDNNQIIKEYSLELAKYLEILDYNLSDYNSGDLILVTVSEIDDQVISVEIDLTSFYKHLEESYEEYKITINYNHINDILEF